MLWGPHRGARRRAVGRIEGAAGRPVAGGDVAVSGRDVLAVAARHVRVPVALHPHPAALYVVVGALVGAMRPLVIWAERGGDSDFLDVAEALPDGEELPLRVHRGVAGRQRAHRPRLRVGGGRGLPS